MVSVTQSRPAASLLVVDRLANVRIGGDQLDREARRQPELLELLLGPQRRGRRDVRTGRPLGLVLRLAGGEERRDDEKQEEGTRTIADCVA